MSPNNKEIRTNQNIASESIVRLSQSLINSSTGNEEYYEEEETFRSEEADLADEAIQFFQGKLEILEERIIMLT